MRPTLQNVRVVVFFTLIVMTTAMAASPIRQSLWPLATRQLARWNAVLPSSSPGLTHTTAQASSARPDGRLMPLFESRQSAPERPAAQTIDRETQFSTVASSLRSSSFSGSGAREDAEDSSSGSQSGARAGKSGGGWSSFAAGLAPGRGAGGLSNGPGSLRRAGRDEFSGRNGLIVNGGAGRSAAPGAASPAAPARQNPAVLFTEHRNGLPVLNRGGRGVAGAGGGLASLTPTSVASTPEPSTLLLLTTGIAMAAGRLRHRFARRS
jgi:hypothetical protein